METLQARTFGEVKVIFDPHLTDRAGQPVDAVITYEADDGDIAMVVTFGAKVPEFDPVWTVLVRQMRGQAGAK